MTTTPSVRTAFSLKSLGFCAVLGLLTFCCEPLATTMTTGLCNTGTTIRAPPARAVGAAAPDPSYALLAGNPRQHHVLWRPG